MTDTVITCPECGTSYRTDAGAIGGNGRTVRCARCKETWFVPSPDIAHADALALDNDLIADAEPLLPTAAGTGAGSRIAPPAPVGPATAVPAAAPTADVVLRDRADADKLRRRRRLIRWIWIVAALIALAGIVTAYLNRQAIVNRQAETATLYRALGVEVRAGGLEIDPPTAKTRRVDGTAVIRVDGIVRNLSSDTAALPLIELSLHDDAGATVAQWFVELSEPRLPAHGRLPFTTEYSAPPETAVGLRYRFASG